MATAQTEWKIGETTETERPAEVEMGILKIKVRRNINRETRQTETGAKRVWTYEYADMTPKQFEDYKEEVAQLDTPFARMVQQNSLEQMEAIAEIYEALAETQSAQADLQVNQQAIMEGLADLYEGVTV